MQARIDALRKAEAEAREEIEHARRQAQRVRATIPGEIEKMRSEANRQIEERHQQLKQELEARLEKLREKLAEETSRKLDELERRSNALQKVSREAVRQRILGRADGA